MLNADQIADAIELGSKNDPSGIAIIPKPDIRALRARGGTSVDLRLGRWFQTVRQTRTTSFSMWGGEEVDARDRLSTKKHFVPFTQPFVLHPGRFVLASTLEWLRLPSNVSGFVTGKSSLGRRGLIIETASGIHPNFSGCLTLELANVGEVPLEIAPGMKICQVFPQTTATVTHTNLGTFSGRRRPTIGSIGADPIWEKLKPKG